MLQVSRSLLGLSLASTLVLAMGAAAISACTSIPDLVDVGGADGSPTSSNDATVPDTGSPTGDDGSMSDTDAAHDVDGQSEADGATSDDGSAGDDGSASHDGSTGDGAATDATTDGSSDAGADAADAAHDASDGSTFDAAVCKPPSGQAGANCSTYPQCPGCSACGVSVTCNGTPCCEFDGSAACSSLGGGCYKF